MYKHMAPEPERRLPRGWKLFGLLVLFFACVVFGALFVDAFVTNRSPRDIVDSLFVPTPQAVFHKDRIAVLLLGVDYNYDEKDQPFSANARTDTIMAVSLNFPTAAQPRGSIGVLSVPRDMDVVFPNGHEDRINAAYALGDNPINAAHRSEKTVASFLGIGGFDRFVTLRINAAKEVVDAIGGIDVVPDETMNYDDSWGHVHIHFVGGKRYHMNGEQAISYSRFRHDECGDPCRIKRQQQVMRIVLNKLESNKMNDLVHITDFIGIMRRNVYTDIGNNEALSIAFAMKNVDLKAVRTTQVPYVFDKDLACCGNVIVADEVAKAQLVKHIFLDPILPPVAPSAAAVAAAAGTPRTIHLDVRNGSGVPGMGHRLAAALQKAGFVVDKVGNADSYDHLSTELRVHATPAIGETVRKALPVRTATVTPDPFPAGTHGVDVTIIVGRDYAALPEREASAVK